MSEILAAMAAPSRTPCTDDWLARFHRGEREVIAHCYREHFATVDAALRHLLSGADRETVIHEVFCALLSDRAMRRRFRGGSIAAWLRTVARNRAIDYLRRQRRERRLDPQAARSMHSPSDACVERQTHLKRVAAEFQRDWLPAKWTSVFEARFVLQLTQEQAAERLQISRTTLAYREQRIRRRLRRFLLRLERSER